MSTIEKKESGYSFIYHDEVRDTWYVDYKYRNSDGKLKTKKKRGFDTPLKAYRWLNSFIKDNVDESEPLSQKSLKAIAFERVESIKPDIKETTYNQLHFQIEKFIPDIPISKFSKARADKWRRNIYDAKKPNGKPYSLKYRNDIITLMRVTFQYAVYHEYTSLDIGYGLKRFKPRLQDKYEYTVVTPEEFFKAYHALPTKTWIDKWFRAMVLVAFSTGLRRAEQKALQFKNYKDGFLEVENAITGKTKGDREKVEDTKTKTSVRKIALDKYTISVLDELVDLMKEHGKYDEEAFIFGGDKPMANNTIACKFKQMDLPCRYHDLRHSHATFLITSGVPIDKVSYRLGHASVMTTLNTYTHLFNLDETKTIETLDAEFSLWGTNGDTF